jgi:hypothetical protein
MQGASGARPLAAMAALEESGFVVLPGPFPWFPSLGPLSSGRSAAGVLGAVGVGMRAGRITARVQWVDMARPVCPRLEPVTSVAAGRVHSTRWSGRYRLLRTDESRDPRATWYRRASRAGTPRLLTLADS